MKAYIFHIQILFSLFLMLIGLYEWHNWGGDYSSYIMQAMALAEGKVDEFIHYNSLTIEKTDGVLGPVAYPWGFPFLLLPIYHMAGFDLYSFKFVGVALAVLSLFIIKKYFSNKTSSKALFFLIFFIAFNPQFYGFTNFILSDIPFLCFSLLSIFLIESIFIKNYQHDSFIQILLLACVSFFAYILRGNGVAIFLTVICINAIQYIKFLKWDKYNSIYKFITYYILIAVLVCTYKLFFPDGTGYKDLSYMTVGSIMSNIKYYAFVLKEFIPFIHWKLATVVYCCTIPFFFSGLFRRWKDCLPYLIFSLITVAIFIAWPPRQGYRFLLPVIPLYLFFVFDDIIYRIGKIAFTGIQHFCNRCRYP